jgi:hypothetical protein
MIIEGENRDEATELHQDIIDFVEDRYGPLETGDREYYIDLLMPWARARRARMMMEAEAVAVVGV